MSCSQSWNWKPQIPDPRTKTKTKTKSEIQGNYAVGATTVATLTIQLSHPFIKLAEHFKVNFWAKAQRGGLRGGLWRTEATLLFHLVIQLEIPLLATVSCKCLSLPALDFNLTAFSDVWEPSISQIPNMNRTIDDTDCGAIRMRPLKNWKLFPLSLPVYLRFLFQIFV